MASKWERYNSSLGSPALETLLFATMPLQTLRKIVKPQANLVKKSTVVRDSNCQLGVGRKAVASVDCKYPNPSVSPIADTN